MMPTAIEYDPYSSMFFLSSPVSASKGVVDMPDSSVTTGGEDKEMILDVFATDIFRFFTVRIY